MVASLDRLTRLVRDFACLVEDRFGRDGGSNLYSASESFDLRTPSGRFFGNLIISFSQYELERGVERSGSVMTAKRSDGKQLGTIPYGSMLDADLETLCPCPSELATISFMKGLRGRGWKLRAIAGELDVMGFATRTGRPWNFASISKILGESQSNAEIEKDPRSGPLQGLGVQPGEQE